jgi:large subunit ribosomal protein L22
MSKPNHPRKLTDQQAEAIARNIRVSPRKLNLVAASIRNLTAGKAVASLTFSKRRIAGQVKKTLESAIANAENNHQLDVDRLVVTTAEVGRGIVMRRFQARGRGKAARVEKWFSHLRIVVAERAEVEAKPHEPRTARGGGRKSTRTATTAAHAAPAAADHEGTQA